MPNQTPQAPLKPGQTTPWHQLPIGHRFNFLGVGETCLKTGDRTYQDGQGCIKTFALSAHLNVINLTDKA